MGKVKKIRLRYIEVDEKTKFMVFQYLHLRTVSMVVVVLGFLAAVFLCVFPVSNFDLFWHLANGRIMVDEGRIVAEEALSYTRPGVPMANHAWLSQILFF